MRFDDYNRAENACRIGLALALVAVLLNTLSLYVIPGLTFIDAFGVVCAVISMAAAYFADSIVEDEFGWLESAFLAWVSIVACFMSYVAWLASMTF